MILFSFVGKDLEKGELSITVMEYKGSLVLAGCGRLELFRKSDGRWIKGY
jgi:hypothetical protein